MANGNILPNDPQTNPEGLKPFQYFCMTIGALPSSYLESLTYQELLIWFCDYLQNTVIPAVNNNAEALEELQNLYVELKNYVDNYFTNLDVQTEINNKLDNMASSGELQELLTLQYNELKNEVNSSISTFENETNQDLNNFKNETNQNINNFKNETNQSLDNFQTKLNSVTSGSPLVANSTSDMTDPSRIYVNTSDNKWYYYNGTSWVSGGTYQSEVLGDNSVTIFKLENILQNNFALNFSEDIDLGDPFQGYIREVDGKLQITQANGYKYWVVPIESGSSYIFNATQNVLACACIVADEDNNVLFVNDSRGETVQVNGIFNCVGNNLKCYIGTMSHSLSNTNIPYSYFETSNRLRKLKSITNNLLFNNSIPLIETKEDYYVIGSRLGNEITLNSEKNYDTFIYPIEKGKTYNINGYNMYMAKGITITDVNYKILYSSIGTSSSITPVNYNFTASQNGFAFLCGNSSHIPTIEIVFNDNIINANIYPNITGKNIIYDGDSITENRTNNGGSFPQLIATKTNSNCVNEASGGAYLSHRETGHSVVDNLSNLPTNGNMYVFQGGINDYWNNVPLGELTENYTDNLNTSTIAGALEQIFRYSLSNFVGKPIVFIMTHKIQQTAINNNTAGYNMSDMNDLFIKACKKYSIPYYNAFDESGLNGWNSEQSDEFLTANAENTGDGIHPNVEGYNIYYVPQLLSLYQKLL